MLRTLGMIRITREHFERLMTKIGETMVVMRDDE